MTDSFIDYVTVNQRLSGSIRKTRVYENTVTGTKSKYHHRVKSTVSLKLKFMTGISGRQVVPVVMTLINTKKNLIGAFQE